MYMYACMYIYVYYAFTSTCAAAAGNKVNFHNVAHVHTIGEFLPNV